MTDPGHDSFEHLTTRVLRGDARAAEEFFRREQPAVYRLCFGFLLDATEAEDAAQDSLLRLHASLAEFDRSRTWSSWRNTLVLNHCRDRLRRRATRRRAEGVVAIRDRETAIDPAPGPERSFLQTESLELLRSALSLLSDREREVFILRDLEGQESADVAAELAITEGTVRSLLCLARKRLRDALSDTLLDAPRIPRPKDKDRER